MSFNSRDDTASISLWIDQLKEGNCVAGQKLWNRYVQRLARLACAKLGNFGRTVEDEEDVALSVFHALLRGTENGRFPKLDDRNDLWQILSMLTEKKAIDSVRRMRAQKRGGNEVAENETTLLIDGEPTPDMAAQYKDTLNSLINEIPDEHVRLVVAGKLEGRTIGELSKQLGLARRTIDRKLQLVRKIWSRKLEQSQESIS